MKIAVFELEEWERDAFDQLKDEHDLVLRSEQLNADNASDYADADAISTFIYSDLGRSTLGKLDNLRMIATRSTGYDHIDVDYCQHNDITVSNVPGYGENTVAEHVFGLLLTISHRLYDAIDRTRKGDFSLQGLEGFDLQGRTLGVIGTGDIGKHAIRIGRGFGMDVLAFDVKKDEQAARDLGFEYVEMDDLLRRSDVITLHVPGTDKTKHLISKEQFDKMKDGAVLINTARGEVVDVPAMVEALAQGKLSAGLDVLPQEPVIREEAELLRSIYQKKHDLRSLLADEALTRMRNVVVTPHSGFYTHEALQRLLDVSIDNITAYAGGHPRNVVT